MLPASRAKDLLGSIGEVVMRRLCLVSGSVTAILLISVMPTYACGDKLLALNRGPRFQDFSGSRRASILMYGHKFAKPDDFKGS